MAEKRQEDASSYPPNDRERDKARKRQGRNEMGKEKKRGREDAEPVSVDAPTAPSEITKAPEQAETLPFDPTEVLRVLGLKKEDLKSPSDIQRALAGENYEPKGKEERRAIGALRLWIDELAMQDYKSLPDAMRRAFGIKEEILPTPEPPEENLDADSNVNEEFIRDAINGPGFEGTLGDYSKQSQYIKPRKNQSQSLPPVNAGSDFGAGISTKDSVPDTKEDLITPNNQGDGLVGENRGDGDGFGLPPEKPGLPGEPEEDPLEKKRKRLERSKQLDEELQKRLGRLRDNPGILGPENEESSEGAEDEAGAGAGGGGAGGETTAEDAERENVFAGLGEATVEGAPEKLDEEIEKVEALISYLEDVRDAMWGVEDLINEIQGLEDDIKNEEGEYSANDIKGFKEELEEKRQEWAESRAKISQAEEIGITESNIDDKIIDLGLLNDELGYLVAGYEDLKNHQSQLLRVDDDIERKEVEESIKEDRDEIKKSEEEIARLKTVLGGLLDVSVESLMPSRQEGLGSMTQPKSAEVIIPLVESPIISGQGSGEQPPNETTVDQAMVEGVPTSDTIKPSKVWEDKVDELDNEQKVMNMGEEEAAEIVEQETAEKGEAFEKLKTVNAKINELLKKKGVSLRGDYNRTKKYKDIETLLQEAEVLYGKLKDDQPGLERVAKTMAKNAIGEQEKEQKRALHFNSEQSFISRVRGIFELADAVKKDKTILENLTEKERKDIKTFNYIQAYWRKLSPKQKGAYMKRAEQKGTQEAEEGRAAKFYLAVDLAKNRFQNITQYFEKEVVEETVNPTLESEVIEELSVESETKPKKPKVKSKPEFDPEKPDFNLDFEQPLEEPEEDMQMFESKEIKDAQSFSELVDILQELKKTKKSSASKQNIENTIKHVKTIEGIITAGDRTRYKKLIDQITLEQLRDKVLYLAEQKIKALDEKKVRNKLDEAFAKDAEGELGNEGKKPAEDEEDEEDESKKVKSGVLGWIKNWGIWAKEKSEKIDEAVKENLLGWDKEQSYSLNKKIKKEIRGKVIELLELERQIKGLENDLDEYQKKAEANPFKPLKYPPFQDEYNKKVKEKEGVLKEIKKLGKRLARVENPAKKPASSQKGNKKSIESDMGDEETFEMP